MDFHITCLPYQDDVSRERAWCPYFKGQGRTCSFSVCMYPVLKDFKIIWHKCLDYQDNVSQERTTPLSQRSRTHLQFQCLYTYFRIWAVIPLCIEGFCNNMAQVFSISRRQVRQKYHTSTLNVKVTLLAWLLICTVILLCMEGF